MLVTTIKKCIECGGECGKDTIAESYYAAEGVRYNYYCDQDCKNEADRFEAFRIQQLERAEHWNMCGCEKGQD